MIKFSRWLDNLYEPGTQFYLRGNNIANPNAGQQLAAWGGDLAGSVIAAPLVASTAAQIGAGLYNAAAPEALDIPGESLANLAALGAMGYGAYRGISRYNRIGGMAGLRRKFADQNPINTAAPAVAVAVPVTTTATARAAESGLSRGFSVDDFANPGAIERDEIGRPLDPAYLAVETALTEEQRANIRPEQYNALYQEVAQRIKNTGDPVRAGIYAENDALDYWLTTPEGQAFDQSGVLPTTSSPKTIRDIPDDDPWGSPIIDVSAASPILMNQPVAPQAGVVAGSPGASPFPFFGASNPREVFAAPPRNVPAAVPPPLIDGPPPSTGLPIPPSSRQIMIDDDVPPALPITSSPFSYYGAADLRGFRSNGYGDQDPAPSLAASSSKSSRGVEPVIVEAFDPTKYSIERFETDDLNYLHLRSIFQDEGIYTGDIIPDLREIPASQRGQVRDALVNRLNQIWSARESSGMANPPASSGKSARAVEPATTSGFYGAVDLNALSNPRFGAPLPAIQLVPPPANILQDVLTAAPILAPPVAPASVGKFASAVEPVTVEAFDPAMYRGIERFETDDLNYGDLRSIFQDEDIYAGDIAPDLREVPASQRGQVRDALVNRLNQIWSARESSGMANPLASSGKSARGVEPEPVTLTPSYSGINLTSPQTLAASDYAGLAIQSGAKVQDIIADDFNRLYKPGWDNDSRVAQMFESIVKEAEDNVKIRASIGGGKAAFGYI